MTEHERMPTIHRYTARWLCPVKIVIVIDGKEVPARRDDVMELALAITEVLQLEVRP